MVKWIIIAVLFLPVLEIGVFVLVAALIGLLWAFMLMLATTLTGFFVLRRAGRGQLARFRVAVADNNITGLEASASSFLTVLGGLLLFLPGFVTDLIGAMLLIRPVRRWCGAAFRRAFNRRTGREEVIDLAPGEWTQVRDPELENKRGRPRPGGEPPD